MFSLAIQSFGKESEYRRAILAILSFFSWCPHEPKDIKVILFTDRPDYFTSFLNGLSIKYVLLTPSKILEMRGEINFLHRMKIALIEEAFTLTDGCLIYADSDTFFTGDVTPFVNQVAPDKSFMHVFEYEFEHLRDWELPAGKSFVDFLKLIESENFTIANGERITVTPACASWNAGVMIFHHLHARFIPDVYKLTDQFYPSTQNHASEQYAFSIVLQKNTDLESCNSIAYHYWYRIKKLIMDQFLERKITQEFACLSLENKLDQIKQWTIILPGYFEEHIWMVRDNAIQAFCANDFRNGYKLAIKAVLKKPFNKKFLKDTIYHINRHLTHK